MGGRGVAGQRDTAVTSACARARRTLCRLVLVGAFCLFGWVALAVVDAGSAAASEHSAGDVGLGPGAEHGGLPTAALGADTDHATTGVEARGPARHETEPADRAEASDTTDRHPADFGPLTNHSVGEADAGEQSEAAAQVAGLSDQVAAPSADATAPVAGLAGSLGAPAADATAPATSAPADGLAEAAAPIAGVVEKVSAPLTSAAEQLPEPGAPWLPGAEEFLPGLVTPQPGDDTPDAPTVPGNDAADTAPASHAGGAAVVSPVAPGMELLPAVPTDGFVVSELAAADAGAVEQPNNDLPAQPGRSDLPGSLDVGSVPTSSNGGGAGNGPAAQDAELVGAASEQILLGVARTSDRDALSNDGDKPPVSPD